MLCVYITGRLYHIWQFLCPMSVYIQVPEITHTGFCVYRSSLHGQTSEVLPYMFTHSVPCIAAELCKYSFCGCVATSVVFIELSYASVCCGYSSVIKQGLEYFGCIQQSLHVVHTVQLYIVVLTIAFTAGCITIAHFTCTEPPLCGSA